MEKHKISVKAENGAVMGTANGSSYFKGNYAQSMVPTYFGEAQTVVQAQKPGRLKVVVHDGTNTAFVEVPCVAREKQAIFLDF